jgi:hypothetical protein
MLGPLLSEETRDVLLKPSSCGSKVTDMLCVVIDPSIAMRGGRDDGLAERAEEVRDDPAKSRIDDVVKEQFGNGRCQFLSAIGRWHLFVMTKHWTRLGRAGLVQISQPLAR